MARIDMLRAMLDEDPNDSFVQFAIAMEYKSIGNLDKASKEFEKLKDINSQYVGLYFHLAKVYEEMELLEKAMDTYDAGINIANELNDSHAKAELMNERMNLELEL